MPLEEFFLGYRKTALAPDEVIQSLTMPRLWPGESFHCDKVSKRRDQDISTVAGAYRVRIKNGRIEDARLAFGGMAATPKRASHAEAAVVHCWLRLRRLRIMSRRRIRGLRPAFLPRGPQLSLVGKRR